MLRALALLALLSPSLAVAGTITTQYVIVGLPSPIVITDVPAGAPIGVAASASAVGPFACPPQLAPTCLDLRGRAVVLGTTTVGDGVAQIVVTPPPATPATFRAQAAWRTGGAWQKSPAVTIFALDGAADDDADGLSNAEEVLSLYSDPRDTDTDDDGLADGQEFIFGTSLTQSDTDADGLSDLDEVYVFGTSALTADTDGDLLSDADEIYVYATYATVWDTDGGGVGDGVEVLYQGTSPFDPYDDTYVPPYDSDYDGLLDFDEPMWGADPYNPDTDGDGLYDGTEVYSYSTSPAMWDTDGGGVSDGEEVLYQGTDPLYWYDDIDAGTRDSDSDGLYDRDETQIWGTDPFNADTDGDTLWDGAELWSYGTSPTSWDSDGGGLDDGSEVFVGKNPNDSSDDWY